jgi:cytochrome c oxidase subunit 2
MLPLLVGIMLAGDAPFLASRVPSPGQDEPSRRAVTVVARRYSFTPARIEARQGDILIITLVAEDIPHSFTIDAYRICKRASPGEPVKFELHLHKAGTFEFYCSLTVDEGCRQMRGELVVRPPGQP